MRQTRFTPIGANTFAVRIDSYIDGEARGEFLAPGIDDILTFSSLSNLFLLIDDLLDSDDGAAQSAVRPPSTAFDPNVELEVLFRQNHSWQGRIRLVKEKREAAFRSVLELMMIMETAFGE